MGIQFGFVSSYPPTHCGIATFSNSLLRAMLDIDSHIVGVVRLLGSPSDEEVRASAPEVIATISPGNAESMNSAIAALNARDVAVIQHEYGIYGGTDGDDVLVILRNLRVPSIVVLHTVLANPTWHQREIMNEICQKASAVVTMSEAARDRLLSTYSVEPARIFAIPHGSPPFPHPKNLVMPENPMILTWGLIGPGKGIEWAIEAFAHLKDFNPMPHYVVAGQTHPKVLAREGNAYRDRLHQQIERLGLTDCVELRSEYLDDVALAKLVSSASAVLLPYDTTDQVTSGVLIEAVTAHRPVVATDFPHAVELLSQGVGTIVAHHDPVAMADALRRILENPDVAHKMSDRASILSSRLLWPAVATRYIQLARSLIRTRAVA